MCRPRPGTCTSRHSLSAAGATSSGPAISGGFSPRRTVWDPDVVLAPYDVTLKDAGRQARRQSSRSVLEAFDARIGAGSGLINFDDVWTFTGFRPPAEKGGVHHLVNAGRPCGSGPARRRPWLVHPRPRLAQSVQITCASGETGRPDRGDADRREVGCSTTPRRTRIPTFRRRRRAGRLAAAGSRSGSTTAHDAPPTSSSLRDDLQRVTSSGSSRASTTGFLWRRGSGPGRSTASCERGP